LKEINIFQEEQFNEWYLCDVNKNGQVFIFWDYQESQSLLGI
jgi:hypothetical protein